jgi:ribosomal protein S18 acetylase RimI-like enzyme
MSKSGARGAIWACWPFTQGNKEKGLGRVMVDASEDYFRQRGCPGVDLVVVTLRPDLPPFYRKLGYEETGTEEFRPSPTLKPGLRCHCLVMSKAL